MEQSPNIYDPEVQLIERTKVVLELMEGRGYKQTGSGSGGESLFFLKKIDEIITVHAFVKVRRLNVELDIIGTLGMNIKLATNPILVDTNCFDKTEEELIRYGRILAENNVVHSQLQSGVGQTNAPGMEEVSRPKVEKTFDQRKKELWEKIRQVGKQKSYEKDMCIQFYEYWTQKNEQGKKMRFEKEGTWDLAGRLRTWLRNDKVFLKRYETREEKKATVQNTELAETGTKHIKHSDLF